MNFDNVNQVKLGNIAEIDLIKFDGVILYERIPLYVPYEFKDRSDIVHVKTLVNKTHTDLSYMFSGSYNLLSVSTKNWNTSNVTTMKCMFESSHIGSYGLDLSNFNTSKVTDMSSMFCDCYITSLDVSNFDTSNVTDMSYMFSLCILLKTLNINNWDISSVTNIGSMFYGCKELTELDLSNWKTSHVTWMSGMFSGCDSLESLNLSNWDVSSTTMSYVSLFNQNSRLHTLRLDNCNNNTIKKILNAGTFPTGYAWDGVTGHGRTIIRKLYCKKTNATGLTLPDGWEFVFVPDVSYDEPTEALLVPESITEAIDEQLTINQATYDPDNENLNI